MNPLNPNTPFLPEIDISALKKLESRIPFNGIPLRSELFHGGLLIDLEFPNNNSMFSDQTIGEATFLDFKKFLDDLRPVSCKIMHENGKKPFAAGNCPLRGVNLQCAHIIDPLGRGLGSSSFEPLINNGRNIQGETRGILYAISTFLRQKGYKNVPLELSNLNFMRVTWLSGLSDGLARTAYEYKNNNDMKTYDKKMKEVRGIQAKVGIIMEEKLVGEIREAFNDYWKKNIDPIKEDTLNQVQNTLS